MTDAVRHRGPDGEGLFIRDRVALGHRRLSIIDPKGGKQPMSNEDGTVWVTYNGEIYNFRELRTDLEVRGHRFVTNCDTEVVVHAYEEWGCECVKRFRGMFAFGIADFTKRRIFLARDHFGIKPLFYRQGRDYFAFASELAALRAVDDECPAGNVQAVEFFLRYQYIPAPLTIYKDIFKLPPGHCTTVAFDGTRAEPSRYWRLRFEPEDGVSDAEWEERAAAVFRETVEAHLVSDVPFGVLLSGGNDSSLVAAEMSRLLDHPVEAFNIGFEEADVSETTYAKQAAERLGIRLHTETVKESNLAILPEVLAHYGEPFGDSSCLPTWHVARLARQYVPMVLSGDGGDEAFGGYSKYAYWLSRDRRFKMRELMRDRRFHSAALMWLLSGVDSITGRLRNRAGDWRSLTTTTADDSRRALWQPEYRAVLDAQSEQVAGAMRMAGQYDRLTFAQSCDYETYLPGAILTKVDIASMFHGLEVRTPLVDLRVVEFAATLPVRQRVRIERARLRQKYVMKQVLERTFPVEFVRREKQGFGIPYRQWLVEGSSGRDMFMQVVTDPGTRINDLFEPAQIRKELSRHTPDTNNFNILWFILIMGIWMQQNPEVSFG